MGKQKYFTEEERKAANNERARKWREKHPEYCHKWYMENQEEIKKKRLENSEKKKAYMREWYQKNREKQLADKRKYYQENQESLKQKQRDYDEKHKEEKSSYMKGRYNTLHGRALNIVNNCNRDDREYNRPKGDLTVEWVEEQIQKGCAHKEICGVTDWRLIGLNRIDNSLSHTKANCEPCCWECNNRLHHEEVSKPLDLISSVDGEVIATYPSASEAARQLGFQISCITAVCRGERKTHKGYIFRYF